MMKAESLAVSMVQEKGKEMVVMLEATSETMSASGKEDARVKESVAESD